VKTRSPTKQPSIIDDHHNVIGEDGRSADDDHEKTSGELWCTPSLRIMTRKMLSDVNDESGIIGNQKFFFSREQFITLSLLHDKKV
jgi:hypothetical protein